MYDAYRFCITQVSKVYANVTENIEQTRLFLYLCSNNLVCVFQMQLRFDVSCILTET